MIQPALRNSAPNTATVRKYVAVAETMGTRRSIASQADVDAFSFDLGGGARMDCLAGNGFVRGRANRVSNQLALPETPATRPTWVRAPLGRWVRAPLQPLGTGAARPS